MAGGYWATPSVPLYLCVCVCVCVCVCTGPATVHSGIMDMYVGPLVWQTAECAANGNASAIF